VQGVPCPPEAIDRRTDSNVMTVEMFTLGESQAPVLGVSDLFGSHLPYPRARSSYAAVNCP
jgi:hypothetical protein